MRAFGHAPTLMGYVERFCLRFCVLVTERKPTEANGSGSKPSDPEARSVCPGRGKGRVRIHGVTAH